MNLETLTWPNSSNDLVSKYLGEEMLERIRVKKLKQAVKDKTPEELMRAFDGFPEVLEQLAVK